MAIKLCTIQDVADWWSQEGVDARLDDNRNDLVSVSPGEADILLRIIERGSAVVAMKLSQRYTQDSYAGSGTPPASTPALVSHFAAVVSAYFLGIRRNLPISPHLKEEYERVLKMLDDIVSGVLSIPDLAESFEMTPFLTNYHVDGTYRSAKFRKVDSTSVGKSPTPPIKSHPENYHGGIFE